MKQRMISCLLALCLLAGTVPSAYAADGVIPNDATGIPDTTLYQFLLSQADANEDGLLTRSEAAALDELVIIGYNDLWEDQVEPIRSLQGLSYFSQVERLMLNNLTGVDFSPISQLANVREASLMGMDNTCIPVIGALPKLEKLIIMDIFPGLFGQGTISDLSGLAGASSLQTFVVINNPIEDISPLAGLTGLRTLAIAWTLLTDLSPLTELTELEGLLISSDVITTLPDLTGLTKLTPESTQFTGCHIPAAELRQKLPPQLAQNKAWIISNKYPYAGDMDADDAITIVDVMELCKVLARQAAGDQSTPDEIDRGDMNGDEQLTISDVMEICKLLARQAAIPY